MIVASNRYPGQLMPVGARYWYNAGQPLNAMKYFGNPVKGLGSPDGLGGPLAVSGTGALTESQLDNAAWGLRILLTGALGYYIGTKLARSDARRFAGVMGAVTSATLGVPGLALTTFLYAPKK